MLEYFAVLRVAASSAADPASRAAAATYVILILFFYLGIQFPGNEKNYAMQYKTSIIIIVIF